MKPEKPKKTDALIIHDRGKSQPSPVVVFLHGFPFTRSMWRIQIESLINEIRAVDYDLRGFGENPSDDGITTIEEHADDLLRALDGIKRIFPVVLCGHSLGGFVALRAFEREPQRFAGLVLCGAHAKAPTDQERLQWADHIRSITQTSTSRFVQGYLDSCFTSETRETPTGEYDQALEEANATPSSVLKGAMLAMMGRTDTLRQLERTNPPLLLLAGSRDSITPPEALLRMGLGITGTQFVRIPQAAHSAPLDNSEFFTNALHHFIDSETVRQRMK